MEIAGHIRQCNGCQLLPDQFAKLGFKSSLINMGFLMNCIFQEKTCNVFSQLGTHVGKIVIRGNPQPFKTGGRKLLHSFYIWIGFFCFRNYFIIRAADPENGFFRDSLETGADGKPSGTAFYFTGQCFFVCAMNIGDSFFQQII